MLDSRLRTTAGVAAFAALLSACGGKGTTSTTAAGGSSATSTSATMSTSGTMSTGTMTTATASTGTSMGGSCLDYKLAACTQMKMCAPHQYQALYGGDDALCQSEAMRLCGMLPNAYDNTNPGVVDPAGCLAAINGSCNAYLRATDGKFIPAACETKPGNLTADKGCAISAQCGAGLICYTDGPSNCPQYCGAVGKLDKPCGTYSPVTPVDSLCDPANNLHCALAHQGSPSGYACRTVTYGMAGDACVYNSDETCDSGLVCNNMSKCVALLAEGAVCTLGQTETDPCDHRLGLSCLPNDPSKPNGPLSCQTKIIVPDGATCGMVMDPGGITHEHDCDAYSYCETSTNVCKRKATLNQGCVANECFQPYVCTNGTCQAPPLVTDPACTANTMPASTTLTCAVGQGGIVESCPSSDACCAKTPTGTMVGEAAFSCSNTATCAAGSQAQLSCDDSSQCSGGNVCCMSFIPNVSPVTAACVPPAQCNMNLQLCRTDNAAACGGAGCKPSKNTQSDFQPYLPSNVGFCTLPTCDVTSDGCSQNANCCSNLCDQNMNACL